ncbi:hypothetical protein [Fusibacter tunisiensis]|uniref:Cyclic nucleotide-binding domain-containing protein n=1 Tax=Fusibacter tunisiensis TaxID=1008308 RepID=A0ABS2MP82_9FIRM|nr:hypothetical protein [Fusibacter tunisiensis]MBM7561199.1 hypothetical protein [Fusibacter tunisiensis]
MKKMLSLVLVGITAIGAMGMSYAASPFGSADIYARYAEITTEEAYAVKLESGQTFGELAEAAGFYEDFKASIYTAKVEVVEELVAEGELSQEDADAILLALENCDGTQQHVLREKLNFGQGNKGEARGQGMQNGQGMMQRGGRR